MDEYVRKMTEKFMDIVNKSWLEFITSLNALNIYVRSWIDVNYLESVSADWEEYFSRLSRHGSKIKLGIAFEESKNEMEKMIYAELENKAYAFLRIGKESNINWCPTLNPSAETSSSLEPHQYIQDFVIYMSSIGPLLSALPKDIHEKAQSKALLVLATGMINELQSNDLRRLNSQGIRALDSDVKCLESFVAKSGIGDAEKNSLLEIRQLIDLLLCEDIGLFLDEDFHLKHYSLLNDSAKIIRILEKYKEEGRFTFKRSSQTKQVEALLLQLRIKEQR